MENKDNSTAKSAYPGNIPPWYMLLFPVLTWLPQYRQSWLFRDMIAGMTLAAYAIPVAMAYAGLAGLSPEIGIYCYIFSCLVYIVFASSRHLAIGPTAAISLMVAGVIGPMADGNAALYATMAAFTAAMVAIMYLLAWIFRLSTFVNFISETILLGFKAGAALSIISTQIPRLFGLPQSGEHFFDRIYNVIFRIADANPAVMMISFAALLLLILGEKFLPGRPVALVVLILSAIAIPLTGLSAQDVGVIGTVPSGLPGLSFPLISTQYIEGLLELAFACFLLSYVESIAAARTLAAQHNYNINPQQELLALGSANLLSALAHGYPVAGGLSQSAVNERAGAKTSLSLLFASMVLMVAVCFLTGWLDDIPEAVLAAIVIVAVSGFIKISDFRALKTISPTEFNVALAAFLSVLFLGILKGVAVSVIVSLLFLLRLIANPHVSVLGRIPGTSRFSDAKRHMRNERFPGLFLFRVEAPLLYFNVGTIRSKLLQEMEAETQPVKLVVCDLSTSPYIDVSGARLLAQLEDDLYKQGIDFRVAEAHAEVREMLRATAISELLGGVSRRIALADIVEDYERDMKRQQTREAMRGSGDENE